MIEIVYNIPEQASRNATIRAALFNVGNFIRDLWLAQAPYASGAYARGLMQAGSVKIEGSELRITNFAKHAGVIEYGFSSYNWGLRVLANGKNVRTSKDGNRYKVIKIDKKPTSNFRKPTATQRVMRSFAKLSPLGMRPKKLLKYGKPAKYKSQKNLQRPLKGGPPKAGSPVGFFVVSERAIKDSGGKKWQMPAREGYHLAEKVKTQGRAIVLDVVRAVVKQEKDRQMRLNKKPSWYRPGMTGISGGKTRGVGP